MRSRVRSGRSSQRDRATKRRRDRPGAAADTTEPHRELRAAISTLGSEFDLDAYLRATVGIELSAAERLRVLAVERELELPFGSLREIYRRALQLDPGDPRIHASLGVAASEYASVAEREDAAARLHALARAQLEKASAMAPQDASIATARGIVLYMDPACPREEVLAELERAVRLDPEAPWACLYRGHVLQDLGRWAEAVRAYDRVPKDGFDGPKSWRVQLMVEQRAWCLLRSGERGLALAEFERILGRYEAQPHLAQCGDLRYLRLAAEGELPQLRARVDALGDRMDLR